jgi:hypothetical protein
MRTWALALVILGLLSFCLGWFGPDLSRGMRFAVTSWSDNFDDNSIDMQRWTIVQSVGTQVREENQRLRLLWTSAAGTDGLCTTSALNLDSYYVKIDVLTFNGGEVVIRMSTGTTWPFDYYMIVKQYATSKLLCRKGVGGVESIPHQEAFTQAQGSLELRAANGQIEWYNNDVLVYSETYSLASKNLWVAIYGYFGVASANTIELDNFVYSGDGAPQTGDLNVKGYYDGNPVAITNVYYHAPDGSTSTPIDVPASGYTWSALVVGSYTVYGTYQGTTNNTSVTISAGQITYAELDFVSLPQYGSLNVKGYYDGNAVAMTNVFWSSNGASSNPISVPATGYTWTSLTSGSYTVYGTYSSLTIQTTISVIADQTAYAQLNFGGPPPQTGDLNVKGYYDTAPVAFTDCFYRAPDGSASSPINVPVSGYTWTGLVIGTYTIYGTYQGATKQTTISVVVGQPVYAELAFTSSPQPDLLKWLKDLLNDGTVRSGMMLGGACMVGLGFVVLAYPKKKIVPTYPFFS